VKQANRYLEATERRHLAKALQAGDAAAAERLDGVMAVLLQSYRVIGTELVPFLPGPVGEVRAACGGSAGVPPEPRPLFGRIG
jgi:hypothetical protein